MKYLLSLLFVLSGYASAHEWTPTYPKFRLSSMPGVMVTEMKLRNARKDVEYFEVSVFDADWNGIPFAILGDRVINVKPDTTKKIDIYIKRNDLRYAVYVCSKSKILTEDTTKPMLYSKICSKIK